MKTGSFIALSFLGLAVAQPHGEHRHARFHHAKRDVVTDTVTVVATAEAAVVYVDPEGHVLFTSQVPQVAAAAEPTSTPEPTTPSPSPSSQQNEAVATSYSIPIASPTKTSKSKSKYKPKPKTSSSKKSTPAPAPSTSAKPTTPTTTAAAPPPATTTATSLAGGSGGYIGSSAAPSATGGFSPYGLSYSPYNDDGTCKDQDGVNADFAKMPGFGYVRSYGVDCSQVTTILTAAKAKNMKVFLGVFDLGSWSAELDTMIAAVGNDWSHVWAVSMGNEDMNQGKATVAEIIAATNGGRQQLRNAGFTGPVTHVDTFNQIIDNPELCENSDIATANCHAFFDPDTAAADAGDFVLKQSQAVSKACGGKDTYITESGWPNAGDTNGLACPGLSEQQDALDSLKSSFSSNIFLFSAFDTKWKTDSAGTFNAEKHWGILDQNLKGF